MFGFTQKTFTSL